jgi:hypothetical protein
MLAKYNGQYLETTKQAKIQWPLLCNKSHKNGGAVNNVFWQSVSRGYKWKRLIWTAWSRVRILPPQPCKLSDLDLTVTVLA